MTLTMQRETTEYIYIGVDGQQPTSGGECAFMTAGARPEEADWQPSTIVDNAHPLWPDALSSGSTGDYYVATLIGAYGDDGIELLPDDYQVWVRLTDVIEQPVRIAPEALVIA